MNPESLSANSEPLTAKQRLTDSGGVLSIAAFFATVVVLFSLTTHTFMTQANLLNVIRQISPLLIVAVAMKFVITTGGIDLSVG